MLPGSQVFAADHVVKMLNNGADGMMVFEPGYLNVVPGDTVTSNLLTQPTTGFRIIRLLEAKPGVVN